MAIANITLPSGLAGTPPPEPERVADDLFRALEGCVGMASAQSDGAVRTITDVIEGLKQYEARSGQPVVVDPDFGDDLLDLLTHGRYGRRSIWDF